MKWHEPNEQPSVRWVTRKNAEDKIATLKAELAEAQRSEEIMESIVEGVESVMSDIEPEIIYLPEAVKKMREENTKLREALEAIVKHHNTMMNGTLHTATWYIAKKALSET